ncbi:MAG TPA: glycosyltransferase [Acidisoma sp.]|uniref:glycosyltransferase n=1 Tax=Acidisoma sp. TaxID=1872115 RepID=UPI002BAF5E21|nr:glycosyltransferase [Acidisoma sp.]HTI01619.1 glycosyltransferase [Acidisoma sp.]
MPTATTSEVAPSAATAPQIAVLVPCRDEALTIGTVIRAFQSALPAARIHVYDNASTDGTAAIAAEAGALVRQEMRPGKGHVVRRMFAEIEAEAYVLVDGDGTYDAADAPEMVRLLLEDGLDMVTGVRVDSSPASYRPGHRFGNRVLTAIVRSVFGDRISDMLSGYRVFSRRFVKSFPALSTGFETETEFTVHALELGLPLGEVRTRYSERPEGSASKLRTWRDGVRILHTIVNLVREERPLMFFSACGAAAILIGVALAVPVVAQYMANGLVPRLPTAILAACLELLGFLSLFSGLILDSVARGRKEAKRIAYLAVSRTLPSA